MEENNIIIPMRHKKSKKVLKILGIIFLSLLAIICIGIVWLFSVLQPEVHNIHLKEPTVNTEIKEESGTWTYSLHLDYDRIEEYILKSDVEKDMYTIESEEEIKEVDKETFFRMKDAVDYVLNNKSLFNQKSYYFNRLNTIGDSDFYCSRVLQYLKVEDTEIIEIDYLLWLEEIEYIRDFKIPKGNYKWYVNFEPLFSDLDIFKENQEDRNIIDMYKNQDDFIIVDFKTYARIWRHYMGLFPMPYLDITKNYVIIEGIGYGCNQNVNLEEFSVENNKVNIKLFVDSEGSFAGMGSGDLIIIPLNKNVRFGDVDMYYPEYKSSKYYFGMMYKPVIYLYNYDEEVNVQVKFSEGSEFTVTYPEYPQGGWTVKAKPDGHLIMGDKTYRYLYWEGKTNTEFDFDKGFCIRGSDTATFLEEKLSELGLTEDEINEFIIYWLPLMQNNPYNVVSFQSSAYTENADLIVTPTPDTMLRVFMSWYPSDTFVEIEEQELVSTERIGKTVVEWGGSKVK